MVDLQAQICPDMISAVTVVDGKVAQDFENPSRAVVVTYGESQEEIVKRCLNHKVRHICQTDEGSLECELNTTSLMVQNSEKFLAYPISSILSPADVSALTEKRLIALSRSFSQAGEKVAVLAELRQLLMDEGRSESLIADAVLVADEMFTNAIFNAPFVDPKTGFNPGIDRSDDSVHMKNGRHAELFMGYDQNRLVIACRDPYGSLNLQQFLKRIHDCCINGVSGAMRMGGGGAGIGSHMVFNISSSMYVGVSHGKTTVVGASIHWKWSGRRRSEATKNLHCFED